MSTNTKIIVVLISLIAIAVLVGVLFLPDPEKIDIVREGPVTPNTSVPQVVTQVFPPEYDDKYIIQAEYPKLQGLSNSSTQDRINSSIQGGIFNQIANFREASVLETPFQNSQVKNALDASFEVSLITKSFFSAIMFYSTYSVGAAHPNNYNVALNYDLANGASVSLEDIFHSTDASVGYMQRLSDYVREELVRQLGNGQETIDVINAGAAPSPENYKNFTLDKDGISIHFEPYQVASGAAGSPTVKIPYEDLFSTIIKPAPSSATSSVGWWLE